MASFSRFVEPLIGCPERLPDELLQRFPELGRIRLRRGGLPPCIGGWALARARVAAITLWRTVFISPGVPVVAELLLHESRHVEQFESSLIFPIRYLIESARHGYRENRFEADARAYARQRLSAEDRFPSPGEV